MEYLGCHPVLSGYLFQERGCAMLAVWCDQCGQRHLHSDVADADTPEHRAAHCSKMLQGGYSSYYVKRVGIASSEMISEAFRDIGIKLGKRALKAMVLQ